MSRRKGKEPHRDNAHVHTGDEGAHRQTGRPDRHAGKQTGEPTALPVSVPVLSKQATVIWEPSLSLRIGGNTTHVPFFASLTTLKKPQNSMMAGRPGGAA